MTSHPLSLKPCGYCGEVPPTSALLICGRCRTERYCDASHQKQAWPTHKKICRKATGAPRSVQAPAPQFAGIFGSAASGLLLDLPSDEATFDVTTSTLVPGCAFQLRGGVLPKLFSFSATRTLPGGMKGGVSGRFFDSITAYAPWKIWGHGGEFSASLGVHSASISVCCGVGTITVLIFSTQADLRHASANLPYTVKGRFSELNNPRHHSTRKLEFWAATKLSSQVSLGVEGGVQLNALSPAVIAPVLVAARWDGRSRSSVAVMVPVPFVSPIAPISVAGKMEVAPEVSLVAKCVQHVGATKTLTKVDAACIVRRWGATFTAQLTASNQTSAKRGPNSQQQQQPQQQQQLSLRYVCGVDKRIKSEDGSSVSVSLRVLGPLAAGQQWGWPTLKLSVSTEL